MRPLVIRTWSHVHSGKWLVIRTDDRRVLFESHDPRQCLRWLDVWGPMLGTSKHGTPLSPKAKL